MLYKTMVLELIQQRPEMHQRLRTQRRLLATLDRYAMELKSSHDLWKEQLAKTRPDSDPNQLSSEALELALRDLSLPTESQSDDTLPSTDAEPAHISNPSQPA